MNTNYNFIKLLFNDFKNQNKFTKNSELSFDDQRSLWYENKNLFPSIYGVIRNINLDEQIVKWNIDIYFLDLLLDNRSNEISVMNNTLEIANQFQNFIHKNKNNNYSITNFSSLTPLNNFDNNRMNGWKVNITLETKREQCFGKDDIQPSPLCEPVFFQLINSNEQILIQETQLPPGLNEFIAPDSTVSFNNLPLATIPSGNNVNLNCASSINELVSLVAVHPGILFLQGFYEIRGIIVNGKETYQNQIIARIQYTGTNWQILDLQTGSTYNAAPGNEAEPWLADWSSQGLVMNSSTISDICCGLVPDQKDTFVTKTGQQTSYIDFDDGFLQEGREDDFYLLEEDNPAGHRFRLMGKTGGYFDGTDFRDKDGNITTKALAFPDDVLLNWFSFKGTSTTGQVEMWRFVPVNFGDFGATTDPIWDNYIEHQHTSTVVGSVTIPQANYAGYTDWRLPNLNQLFPMLKRQSGGSMNYEPFNLTGGSLRILTNETNLNNSSQCVEIQLTTLQTTVALSKTALLQAFRMCLLQRRATYTVVGGNVIIS